MNSSFHANLGHIDATPCWHGRGEQPPKVFITLDEWDQNGPCVQSRPLSPQEARRFSAELLSAADRAEEEGRRAGWKC